MVTGGTGGHIYPALALADTIKRMEPDTYIWFFGNDNRMEAQLIPEKNYPFVPLHASGLVGNVLDKAKAVGLMMQAYQKAKKTLKENQPDVVIGFGGYVSAPVLLASRSLGIPAVIHEQNSIIGKSNKLVMNQTNLNIVCYQKAYEEFGKERTLFLGNPRATTAFESEADEDYFAKLGLDPDKKTILVMMGSLGSSSVNGKMTEALRGLDDSLQFIYVCGKDNEEDLHTFDDLKNVKAVPYIDTLKIYKKLDGIICRAGATTLAEITAIGLPAILIPSPFVANNHQFYNATMLVEQGAADMIEEKDLNPKSLKAGIENLFLNSDRMKAMRSASSNMGKPNAAYDIAQACFDLVERSRKG